MKLIAYENVEQKKLYQMLKALPRKEWDFENPIVDVEYNDFLSIYNKYLEDEFDEYNPTKRYVLEDNNQYIGYIAIRLSKDPSWLKNGCQLSYQILESERGKGYCNKLIELAITKMKDKGFDTVRINCNNENIPSKKAIIKNGGIVDIKDYKSNTGISSSYVINL